MSKFKPEIIGVYHLYVWYHYGADEWGAFLFDTTTGNRCVYEAYFDKPQEARAAGRRKARRLTNGE